jgi:tetratricopeptide (TPR) repeat protein
VLSTPPVAAGLAAVALLLSSAAAPPESEPGAEVEESSSAVSDTGRRGAAYYHFMLATFAARRGNARTTLTEIRRALELQPESADLMAESAGLLVRAGRPAEAEKLSRSAVQLDPKHPKALRLLADLAASRAAAGGDDGRSRDEAIRMYAALAEDPAVDEEVLRMLASLRLQAGDRAGAVEVTRRLAERRTGDARLVSMLARLLDEEGQKEQALAALLDFLGRYGEEPSIFQHVLDLARTTEGWALVAATCSKLLERSPDSLPVCRLHGQALLQLERYAEAARWIEHALELSPKEPMLLFHLYTAYDGMGRLADAAAAAHDLSTAAPGNPAAQTVLGEALARQRRLDTAIEALEAALRGFLAQGEHPAVDRDKLRWRIAELQLERGRTEQAERILAQLDAPDKREARELRFRLALSRGDLAAAGEALGGLRPADPGLAALLEGELLVLEGRAGRARAKFKEAVSGLGLRVSARIAEIWRDADQPGEGERVVRAWVHAEPQSADAHFTLGSYLEREGRFEEAEPELELAIRLDPTHAHALNYLGYSLGDRSLKLDRALELVQRALQIDPWNGAYLDSLGWVYYRMGRFDEALEPLERAAREFPTDPTVLDHLGDVYHRLGRTELAQTMWRRALEAGPRDADTIRDKIEAAGQGERANGGHGTD